MGLDDDRIEGIVAQARDEGHVPGETGIWLFIGADITMFSLFFLIFSAQWAEHRAQFTLYQATLQQSLGLLNTFLLLTSSLFIAQMVRAMRSGDRAVAHRRLSRGIACGILFIIVKAVEYQVKVAAGFGLNGNGFITWYFMLTGIHLVHVVAGLAVLFYLRSLIGKPYAGSEMIAIETGASFWHLVDILWVIIFALLYVIR